MSRLAKKPITIPEKTEIKISAGIVSVKGPLGEVSRTFGPLIDIKVDGAALTLVPKTENKNTKALWGTYASHVKNMIQGVNKAFEKKLIIEGIGFKAEVKGNEMVLALGFSHPVKMPIPPGLKVTVEKGVILVSGINKEAVGQFAAKIRDLKKPEPYKGKGIRYDGEVIKMKEGKKTA